MSETPLHRARNDVAELLINHGALLNEQNNVRNNVLYIYKVIVMNEEL